MVSLVSFISLFLLSFFLIPLASAQYTDSYTDSYTGSYTSSYESGYTGGYEGGYENGYTDSYQGNYQSSYQGSYQGSYPVGPFGQNLPQAICNGNNPNIVLSWGASSGAFSYGILYVDSDGAGVVVSNPSWTSNVTQFTMTGLIPGHRYTFRIQANGNSGQTSSDAGNWSHVKFGTHTIFPNCSAPGNFSFSGSTVAACQGVGAPTMTINWAVSSGADYYLVTPVTNNSAKDNYPPTTDGALQPVQVSPGTATSYTHVIPGAIGPGEQWRYEVVAYNNWGSTPITGSTTSPTFPANCELPGVTYTITHTPPGGSPTTSLPVTSTLSVTTASGGNYTLNWSSTNANTCSGSGSLVVSTTPGSDPDTITYPPDLSKTYTLTCQNTNIAAFTPYSSISRTIIVNVDAAKPFFRTTGGDVHTNESIYITP